MKTVRVAALLLLCLSAFASCSSSPAERTPGETLTQYFDALDAKDTTRMLALCTQTRYAYIAPMKAEYFKLHETVKFKIEVLGERSTEVKDQSYVRFIQSMIHRSSGATVAIDTLDCEMLRENDGWKVMECKKLS